MRCLLRYLSAGELDYIYTDTPQFSPPPDIEIGRVSGTDEETQTVESAGEASCSLCRATLPLLARCCEVFGYIWGSFANASANSTLSPPPIDYVLRSAKRQAHLFSGGPPQLNLLPSVRSFTSPVLRERVNNLTPWFSSDRFGEPNSHSMKPVRNSCESA